MAKGPSNAIWLALVAATWSGPSRAAGPEGDAFFEAKVRPILVERSQRCHGLEKQSSGLRVDSREALLGGGEGGPAVVPGDPERSPLVRANFHRGDLRMPPKERPCRTPFLSTTSTPRSSTCSASTTRPSPIATPGATSAWPTYTGGSSRGSSPDRSAAIEVFNPRRSCGDSEGDEAPDDAQNDRRPFADHSGEGCG